ncbi:MAG: hypothetical protein RJQ08_15920 [Salinisphaeraceae bacterium]
MASEDDTDHLDLAAGDEPADGEPISYQTFGEQFIRHLVTVPRLRAEVEQILQATMEGSAEALPNELLVASYRFAPHDIEIERRVSDDAEVAFSLVLGGVLTLRIKVMGMTVGLPMDVSIRVAIDVHTFAPLTIKLVPRPLTHRNVKVTTRMPRELRALPTRLLDRINPLAIAVQENIVRQANHRLSRPDLAEAATVDVLALAEGALGGKA